MANEVKPEWYTQIGNVSRFITVRLILSVLAIAGVAHLLAGVDPMIKWPMAIVLVGLLIKETIAEKL